MKHIVYMSRAVHSLNDQALQDLLAQCRRDNDQHGITGILFYSHGNIAQFFEGPAEQVDPLFERIARDSRHSHVRKLIDKSISTRSFAGWSMAFHPLESVGFATLESFLLPHEIPPIPSTLSIADTLLIELVQLAVFGPDPSKPFQHVLPEPPATPE